MMASIRKLFGTCVTPVTHQTVRSAPRDPAKEMEIQAARGDLVKSVMSLERRSWEIRKDLAGGVLRIVSGER